MTDILTPAAPQPRLFLTSMSSDHSAENVTEMIEPIKEYLDGVIFVLNDVPADAPSALYLESVKGAGRIIHRSFSPRHWHLMNETLFTDVIQDGELVLWVDALERPMPDFVSRVKGDINQLMREAEVDMIAYFGKAFLFRYNDGLQYRQSPHWTLTGYAKAIEWAKVEPDETKVRLNVRPLKRGANPYQWVSHYLRYFVTFPAGSNSAALGLDHWKGDQAKNFQGRETCRLIFRQEMRARGFPLTVDGFVAMMRGPLDETLKNFLRAEKTFSDAYHHLVKGRLDVKHSHNPDDALPIE